MTLMTLLPFVTNLIGQETLGDAPFGMSWQEQTLELGAVVIKASETMVLDIHHVARRDLEALSTKEEYRVGGVVNIILLRTDEFIVGVDVRCRQREGVVGLRILTNKTTRPWLGSAHGVVDATLRSPSGMFFNAIVGFRDDVKCTQLGAFCCPLSMIPQPSATALASHERSLRYGAGLFDGDQREFHETSDDVRAIVVRCSAHVERVWVLSSEEYDQLRVFYDRTPLSPGEHVVELSAGEHIERIDVLSHERVNGLRVATNQRETPWFGRSTHGSVKSIFFGLNAGATPTRFAGFHGTIGDKHIGSLGVLWEPVTTAETAKAAKEVTSRPVKAKESPKTDETPKETPGIRYASSFKEILETHRARLAMKSTA